MGFFSHPEHTGDVGLFCMFLLTQTLTMDSSLQKEVLEWPHEPFYLPALRGPHHSNCEPSLLWKPLNILEEPMKFLGARNAAIRILCELNGCYPGFGQSLKGANIEMKFR